MFSARDKDAEYKRLTSPSNCEEDQVLEEGTQDSIFSAPDTNTWKISSKLSVISCSILAAIIGFIAGSFSMYVYSNAARSDVLENVAPRIPLPPIQREFNYPSPFSREPPQGEGAGAISEPIWDSLIPNGLGYFKDESITRETSVPTVFHQLHCLYLLRRAYYSQIDELERFDFGKDRASHVAHCFDYLQQGLTCSADTTLEPAIDKEHGFLGSGFKRQCFNFEQLKSFVEERRILNATGFLADGF